MYLVKYINDQTSLTNFTIQNYYITFPFLTFYDEVNGGWCSWSAWSDCSKSCGSGTKLRARQCKCPARKGVGSSCVGSSSQGTTCNDVVCPGNFVKYVI